jgi:hypothetical protein
VTAKQTWGDKFMGVYLRDEPGGKQIDLEQDVTNASSCQDAAEQYVQAVSTTWSMEFLKEHEIPVVTSDYALYFFDCQAGFNVVFTELGWNNSRTQQIALCRRAASEQGKDWGAIITWTYDQPPYIEAASSTYQDMMTAYSAGADYIIVFDYPQYPAGNPYVHSEQRLLFSHAAVLELRANTPARPNPDQGGGRACSSPVLWRGMGSTSNNIRGLWPADNLYALIWQNLNVLTDKYGLKLDVVYDVNGVNLAEEYANLHFWNETLN